MTPITIAIHRNTKGVVTVSAPVTLWRAAGLQPSAAAIVAERVAPGQPYISTVDKLLGALEQTEW